jgi:putative serine protease PepD
MSGKKQVGKMKRITFKFAVGLMVITIAGAAFIAGCQLNSGSTTTATTDSQTAQNSTTITTGSDTVTQASSGAESISTIYSQASPAVVEINVTVQQMGFFGLTTATDQGSGFLIDTSGDIVTNNHVVEGAISIQIVLANGTTINNAQVIGTDAADDLAVIKVSASAVTGITPLQFDDSAAVLPGQTVIAIGSPYGFMNSVTAGIISGVNRQITETDTYSGTYINISGTLQTDAAINPGNSGGPLLDTNGRVIGINTEIQHSSNGGIAFAVSSNTIQKALPALLKGSTTGASS